MVPLSSVKITRVPTYLICNQFVFVYGAITLYGQSFQTVPLTHRLSADPRSLAATRGISIDFFSSGYLDVSVPRVRSCKPMYSATSTCLTTGGFPHSEILGSKSVCRLPEAYRRLLRPSSPLTAKASTICAYSLDHITPNGRSLKLPLRFTTRSNIHNDF